ncbi:MAG: acyl carrier protein [Firmicutes bacterium]|nr:acyl carrier protein [Bacillota bacterium]
MTDWDRIRAIIAEYFVMEPEEIEPKTNLYRDLDANSIDVLELMTAVLLEFGLEAEEPETVLQIHKAGDLVSLVTGNWDLDEDGDR